jgi:acyl carrier protein
MTPDLTSLTELFRKIFNRPSLQLTRETTAKDVAGWDSLIHMQIIVAVEKHYNVRFAPREMESLQNVGQFLDLIIKKINRRA